jgi:hypothetical protein
MPWRKTSLERSQKAAARARADYLATPLGQAQAAHEQGRRFFELVVPPGWDSREQGIAAILEDIEDVGWVLEHAGYGWNLEGVLAGVYLFRRREPRRAPTWERT